MSELRFNVVEKAFRAKPLEIAVPSERPAEYFGKYVFNREKCSNTCLRRFMHGWQTRWTTARRSTARWPTKWRRA